MVKKLTLIIITILCMGLCACSNNLPWGSEKQNSGSMGGMQVINPLKEVTLDELAAETGIHLLIPENAEEVRYFVLSYDDVKMAQIKFSWNSNAVYLRAKETSVTEAEDISGLNYQWASSNTTQVGACEATIYLKDSVGYIAWLDAATGIVYNLCMTEGADADVLSELANKLFEMVQRDA